MDGDVSFDVRNIQPNRHSAVACNDEGQYRCHACGHQWSARIRRLWWPVSFGWRPGGALRFFDWHGIEVGHDAIEQRVVAQVFHVGALKIRFGVRAPRPDDEETDRP